MDVGSTEECLMPFDEEVLKNPIENPSQVKNCLLYANRMVPFFSKNKINIGYIQSFVPIALIVQTLIGLNWWWPVSC